MYNPPTHHFHTYSLKEHDLLNYLPSNTGNLHRQETQESSDFFRETGQRTTAKYEGIDSLPRQTMEELIRSGPEPARRVEHYFSRPGALFWPFICPDSYPGETFPDRLCRGVTFHLRALEITHAATGRTYSEKPLTPPFKAGCH